MYYGNKYRRFPIAETNKNVGKIAMIIEPSSEDFRCVGQIEYVSPMQKYKVSFSGNWVGWYEYYELKILN